MVKPEKCGHLHLVYHFTVPLRDSKQYTTPGTAGIIFLSFLFTIGEIILQVI